MPFVLDNSVRCAWFIGSQATPYADAVAVQLETDRAIGPGPFRLELANVLRTACRRGRLIAREAGTIVDQILCLPIEFDRRLPAVAELLSLALRYDLSSYDALYLELALRQQLPIATQDAALAEAAWAAGGGLWKPA
jgi:predicted nucleic acid-binding protein